MRRAGYTLIEILVATALTLIMIVAVVEIFGLLGDSVSTSRATLEMTDRLRSAAAILQADLAGVTVTMLPPRRPEADEGYFELIEGPNTGLSNTAINRSEGAAPDTTAGDFDDLLMFTTRRPKRHFVGRCAGATDGGGTIESDSAQVAWFLRGGTLYRRVLLIAPNAPLITSGVFFADNDVSVRIEKGNIVGNTLGDLTKRENRYAHTIFPVNPADFPFDARRWGRYGLPTLAEVSAAWPTSPAPLNLPNYDFWIDPPIRDMTDSGPRAGEDVVLTNVIGFDVQVWDPGVARYVDLGMDGGEGLSGPPRAASGLAGGPARVYDTWSSHYEHNGYDENQNGVVDDATNGFDDNGSGGVDDATERETSAPYPWPLRGIQVTIRVFEPDSRQIRQVTVAQDFLPK
jgi:type II secretory pathway component PulJ